MSKIIPVFLIVFSLYISGCASPLQSMTRAEIQTLSDAQLCYYRNSYPFDKNTELEVGARGLNCDPAYIECSSRGYEDNSNDLALCMGQLRENWRLQQELQTERRKTEEAQRRAQRERDYREMRMQTELSQERRHQRALEIRKMCFVVQNILARWPAARPRCIPPACGSRQGIEPSRAKERIAVQSLAGDFALPAPIDLAGAPLKPTRTVWPLHHQSGARSCSPDTPMTTSWRRLHRDRRKGAFALPFLGTIPSTKGRVHTPWNPDQPYADWMPPSCRRWITAKAHAALDSMVDLFAGCGGLSLGFENARIHSRSS
jgi:hypothetical protein